MILVFLLVSVFLIITLIAFILVLSNIKIQIEKLHISNIPREPKIVFISKISIFLFNKFKIFEIKIDKQKIRNLFKNKKINVKKLRDNNIVKLMKNYKIDIEKLNIEGYFGLEDAAYTSYIISFINTVIPIFLSKRIYKYNQKECKYVITPVYINQNIVNLEINCIISIKIVHIINILLKLLKKGRVKKYERTSNRRAYAYSNE